jgi:hypothetical protein
VRLFGQCLEVGGLGAGHLFVTGDPVVRVFDAVRLLVGTLVGLHVFDANVL